MLHCAFVGATYTSVWVNVFIAWVGQIAQLMERADVVRSMRTISKV